MALVVVVVVIPEARARPSAAETEAHAVFVQVTLPQLDARLDAAAARAQAAQAWFAGELDSPASAFPELVGMPLLDPAVLGGALGALDETAAVRAQERVAPIPEALSPRDQASFDAQRSATLDAEDAAAVQERRFLVGLRALARQVPDLHPAQVDAHIAVLRAATPDDPDDPTFASKALSRGQAEAALASLTAAVVRSATVPGDSALIGIVEKDHRVLTAFFATTTDPLAPLPDGLSHAADRLTRVQPLAGEGAGDVLDEWQARGLYQQLAAVHTELDQARATLVADPTTDAPAVEVGEAALDRARRELAEVRQGWTHLSQTLDVEQVPAPGVSVADALRLQQAAAQVQLAEANVGLAERDLDRARQLAIVGQDVDETTDQEVAKARADAEAAQADAARAAEEGAAQADAELRDQIAAYSARRAEILEQRKAREEIARADFAAITEGVAAQRTEETAALGLGPLEKERQSRLDRVYAESRSLVGQSRRVIRSRQDAAEKLAQAVKAELDGLPAPAATLPQGADSALVSRWREEVEKLRLELDGHRDAAERDTDRGMELLAASKAFRREARLHASADAQSVVQSRFVEELLEELREIPTIVVLFARHLLASVQRAPALLLDLNAIAAFFRGSFELVVLLLLWGFARDRGERWLDAALGALVSVRPGDLGWAARVSDFLTTRGVAGSWANAGPVLSPALSIGVDAFVGLVLYRMLPEDWAVLRLVAFLWLARILFVLGTRLVDVLVTIPGEDRPALRRVSVAGRLRARTTVRVVLGWALAEAVLATIALDVLDADRLSDLVLGLGTAAGWVLAIGVLHVWSPALLGAVAEEADDSISRALVQQRESVLLRAPLAGFALTLLSVRWISALATSVVEQRSGLSWVRTALARQSLRNSDDAPTARIPEDVLARVRRFDPGIVATDAEAALVREEFESWLDDKRRGMVAVTGQRGSGKTRLLARIEDLLGPDADGLPVHPVVLDRDIFDGDDALCWLMHALGAAPREQRWDVDSAVRVLDELEPRIVVVDDLHRCFLRAVGGFAGLRDILTAMHAASDRHFWVCAFHGDNWAYLEGVGGAVNLGVFRKRVMMQPMAPEHIRDWLESHTRSCGLKPTYDDLATEGWMGADPERARERARNAYFRLLAEATRGNPRVALERWSLSLRLGESPGQAAVVLFAQPDSALLVDGGEHALFVLSALVVHDGLDVADLARVLNLSSVACRATCRRLEGIGVLVSDEADEHFDITMAWAPAVHRHLRRKHLIHRE